MSNLKCSCLTCKKEISSNHIHHHYTRLHTREGNYLTSEFGKLGALKSKNIIFKQSIQKWKEYYKSPKKCINCNSDIDWFKKTNQFCSSSCSASFNNKKRTELGWQQTEKQRQSARDLHVIRNKNKLLFTKISFCLVCKKCFPLIKDRKTCSIECYRTILSESAKNNPLMGGNKNNRAYGWYDSPIAGKVWLESSYELQVAQELDKNQVQWNRPSYFLYDDKKYFPDFYLCDYNIYLDPKNDYLIQQDQKKIQSVQEQNEVKIFILDKNNLSWDSIKRMINLI